MACGLTAEQLVFQNSLLILVMHYSRIMPLVNGARYYPSTAVFLNEVMKLAFSLSMALFDIARTSDASTAAGLFGELARAVFTGDSWKLAIPAMLYTLQNSLQYAGVSNLDAPTFQATYQIKILTTALFSVTLLGRSLSLRKWFSLVLLTIGVAIVQLPAESQGPAVLSIKDLKNGAAFHSPRSIWDLKALGNVAAGQLSKRSATYEGIEEDVGLANPEVSPGLGLIAVMGACILSGLAGVYFEKILKDPKGEAHGASLWIRNVQLSFYSLWPALFIGVIFKDGEHIAKTGFFTGYNWVVWLVISLQAAGGVVVALVINYTSNIAKNFATSLSILVSFLASVFFFDFHITSFVSNTYECFRIVLDANDRHSICWERRPCWQPPTCTIHRRLKSARKCGRRRSASLNTRRARDRTSISKPLRRPASHPSGVMPYQQADPAHLRMSGSHDLKAQA